MPGPLRAVAAATACRLTRLLLLLVTAAVLAGCETTPSQDDAERLQRERAFAAHQAWLSGLERFRGSGRMALRTAKDSVSATLDWRQDRQTYELRMSGPFGQGAMRIQGKPGAVQLETAEGRTARAASPEELLGRELGWQVPVSVLRYWIVGARAPGIDIEQLELDGAGRIKRMLQAGFDIRYLAYASMADGALPRELEIQGPDLKLRLVMTRWSTS